MLKKYLNQGDEGMLSSNSNIIEIKREFQKTFEESGKVLIDFSDIRSMSPSFAYECFGQIYDTKEKLEKFLASLVMVNDNRNLGDKIIKAIQRRIMVLS